MSAPTGAEIGDNSAQDLLARLLSKDEYIAVLKYAQDRKLETDSEVFFLVSLLKIFACLVDRILHTVRVAEDGRKDIEATAILVEQNIRETIEREMRTLNGVIAQITRTMGSYGNQFATMAEEMKLLEKDLRATTRDAHSAFELYNRLKDKGSNSTLSRLFYAQTKAALDKQFPLFNESTRDLISEGNRKMMFLVIASFSVQVLLIIFLR